MFNKKKKIKELERLLKNTKNSYDELLEKNIEKEQIEIRKLPDMPKLYSCSRCNHISQKMKAFKMQSWQTERKLCKVYICDECLSK